MLSQRRLMRSYRWNDLTNPGLEPSPPPVDLRSGLPGPCDVRSKMCKTEICRGGRELKVPVSTFFENSKSAAGEAPQRHSRHPAIARTPLPPPISIFSKNVLTGTLSSRPPLQISVLHNFDRTSQGPGRPERKSEIPPSMTHV